MLHIKNMLVLRRFLFYSTRLKSKIPIYLSLQKKMSVLKSNIMKTSMLFLLRLRGVLNFSYFIVWCFTPVKHLGTCDLSGLWLLRLEFLELFSFQNPNPLPGFGEKIWSLINTP
jgi:hypothetical protein